MNDDRRTIRNPHVVDRLCVRLLDGLASLASHHPVRLTLVILMVVAGQARAEWSTVTDRAILTDISVDVNGTRGNTQAIKDLLQGWQNAGFGGIPQHLLDIITETQTLDQDLRIFADANNIHLGNITARLDTLIANSGGGATQDVNVVNFDEIIIHIDDLERLLTTNNNIASDTRTIAQAIEDLMNPGGNIATKLNQIRLAVEPLQGQLDQLLINTQAPSGTTGPAAPGGFVAAIPGQGQPATPVIASQAPVDFTFSHSPLPQDFETPDDLTVEALEWEPPDKTGLQNFNVNIGTSSLGSIFGMTMPDINYSVSMAWYGGTLRTIIHSTMLSIAGLWASLFLFEEFRRYA